MVYPEYVTVIQERERFANLHVNSLRDSARVVYMAVHYWYMKKLQSEGALRMAFYVLSKDQAAIIYDNALEGMKKLDVLNPFCERLFQRFNSRYDMDTYFNLYFAPRGGLFSTVKGVDAYKTAAVLMGIEGDLNAQVAKINSLDTIRYATFLAMVATNIQRFDPVAFQEGLSRYYDKVNNILVNPLNFLSAAGDDGFWANELVILNALKRKNDDPVFIEEYLKNVDLMLWSRLVLNKKSELVPQNSRLNFAKVPDVWRHNARVKLGDSKEALKEYPVMPSGSSLLSSFKVIAAIALVAVIAPYAIQYVTPALKAVAAKTSALYNAALAKVNGTAALAATSDAVKGEIAENVEEKVESAKDDFQDSIEGRIKDAIAPSGANSKSVAIEVPEKKQAIREGDQNKSWLIPSLLMATILMLGM